MSPSSIWNWCFGSKGERTEENIDFECIVFLCEDYTGSDLFVLCKKATFLFHLKNCWVKKRKGEKLWLIGLYGALIYCANFAAVISSDTLKISAVIYMVSKICCCNGVATHTSFLVYYVVVICWFSMLENTYANRLFCFYPFFHSICEDK